MRAQEVIRRYATTLYEAAAETGVGEDDMRRDMEGLVATLEDSSELVDFVSNPLLKPDVKRSGLEALFSGKVQPLTLDFLRLLAERRRAGLLGDIAAAYLEMLDGRSGVAAAEVRSAVELTGEQAERLRQRLAAYTGREIRLDARVDGSVKGGLLARVGDLVFDATVETQLQRLRARLMGA